MMIYFYILTLSFISNYIYRTVLPGNTHSLKPLNSLTKTFQLLKCLKHKPLKLCWKIPISDLWMNFAFDKIHK